MIRLVSEGRTRKDLFDHIFRKQLTMSQVHIRYDGNSFDIDFNTLDVGSESTDVDVRRAVANYFNTDMTKLNNFVVDRNQVTGDLTVRPNASFG